MGAEVRQTKGLLRHRLLADRRALPVGEQSRFSADVCRRLIASAAFAGARRVVAYAAVDGEVDPRGAVRDALHRGIRVHYPRWTESGLQFLQDEGTGLVPGRGGIPEPEGGAPVSPETPGLVFLVPGVAFDENGRRLGRGAGCYDRALAEYPDALRIGLAYEFQLVPSLPEEPWDIRMHAIATEARMLWTGAEPTGVGKETS
jgi:5-formyltetrahydrofolate cyclo-ligase